MNTTVTTASQLLKEVMAIKNALSNNSNAAYTALIAHFSCNGRIPWQVGMLNFERTVDRTIADLSLIPEERRSRYEQTLVYKIKNIVNPVVYYGSASDLVKNNIDEITIDRLEIFHDALIMSGKSFTIEDARVDSIISSIYDILSEMDVNSTDVDDAIRPHLVNLLTALERYSLFGSDGVRDLVAVLIGTAFSKGMEITGPLPDDVKQRINRILGISKATMDGFVYLATGVQAIEWAGTHIGVFGSS